MIESLDHHRRGNRGEAFLNTKSNRKKQGPRSILPASATEMCFRAPPSNMGCQRAIRIVIRQFAKQSHYFPAGRKIILNHGSQLFPPSTDRTAVS